ncbi:TIGR03905 family TSCPD domain-containing protein [Bengtsoniella intestinalis]|uniref:TIGR03905 family TSCPD domain-containing protein n=1 Tax=Bengtsoniella intestinalis TaxID=3073143 RepID=UPI00391F63D9
MSTTVQFRPQGVCSNGMQVTLDENGIIEQVVITGGCNGNLSGISSLIKGMDAKEAIARMEGISCGPRSTSCPDQLSKALRQALQTQNS